MDKQSHIIIERIKDLIYSTEQKHQVSTTQFLDLNQQSISSALLKETHTQHLYYGGYPLAERRCLVLLPSYMDLIDWQDNNKLAEFELSEHNPITILKITFDTKFQSKALTHRDYLGALINLGIERQVIGDILTEDDLAYVFVLKHIADYIVTSLVKVNRYFVSVEAITAINKNITEPKFELRQGTVQSIRIDSILTCAFHISRTAVTEYISSGKVFINYKLVSKNSASLKEGDFITLRGVGKCKLIIIGTQTKKNRYHVTFHLYR